MLSFGTSCQMWGIVAGRVDLKHVDRFSLFRSSHAVQGSNMCKPDSGAQHLPEVFLQNILQLMWKTGKVLSVKGDCGFCTLV